jgi:hypothetical protein
MRALLLARRWQFWNGGRSVAIYSGPRHGPGVYELVDFASDKVVERVSDSQIYRDGNIVAPIPDWARAFF